MGGAGNTIANNFDDVQPLPVEVVEVAFCLDLNFKRFHILDV